MGTFKKKPWINLLNFERKGIFGMITLRLFCISIFIMVLVSFVIPSVTQAWRKFKPTILMQVHNNGLGFFSKFLCVAILSPNNLVWAFFQWIDFFVLKSLVF